MNHIAFKAAGFKISGGGKVPDFHPQDMLVHKIFFPPVLISALIWEFCFVEKVNLTNVLFFLGGGGGRWIVC